ncbi:coiled-coil domain-containing protein 159 isoform X3 [Sphaerodactylus townsendi]|uniref:coiled-coil domain-containing protein 159 isoform X3 n=1 Tax=Sphaerodactylus townsendi TaxID=933632 RepID=UPI0020268FDC|nr:coiled-coil domain-containing protein 159 isoform X3 [Sphaerodactylus townsendi]
MQKWTQDLWKAVVAEVERLHGSMNQKQTSMENLSQEVLESKKFLWEELEDVQAEMRLIYQKLKDQEVDITRNLVNIKKLRENQVRCTKFLAQLRNRGDASETVDHKPGNNKGNDDVWRWTKDQGGNESPRLDSSYTGSTDGIKLNSSGPP